MRNSNPGRRNGWSLILLLFILASFVATFPLIATFSENRSKGVTVLERWTQWQKAQEGVLQIAAAQKIAGDFSIQYKLPGGNTMEVVATTTFSSGAVTGAETGTIAFAAGSGIIPPNSIVEVISQPSGQKSTFEMLTGGNYVIEAIGGGGSPNFRLKLTGHPDTNIGKDSPGASIKIFASAGGSGGSSYKINTTTTINTTENSGFSEETWSGQASLSDTSWDLPGWAGRKSLTVLADEVEENLSDFPVLVTLNDADVKKKANADGSDIRFIDKDGNQLEFEMASYQIVAGKAVAQFWVKVPVLDSSAGTSIFMYYGNPSASVIPALEWDGSGYRAIWHLSETGDGTSNEFEDSSGNNNHGTGGAGVAAKVPAKDSTGPLSASQKFDGIEDFIAVNDNSTLSIPTLITLSAWVKPETTQKSFNFTNVGEYVFTAPAGVQIVKIECWGAQGGSGGGAAVGGLGGYSTGNFAVTAEQVLRVFVGGAGAAFGAGGYNGGGLAATYYGAAGGGGSDVRIAPYDLLNRVIVGGGGGGGEFGTYRTPGGHGGGLNGNPGYYNHGYYPGLGGTQTSGGAAGYSYGWTAPGGFGYGGGTGAYHNAGGGGGWYGGGSGCGYASAGGGSSYIGGVSDGSTTVGVRLGNGQIIITPKRLIISKGYESYALWLDDDLKLRGFINGTAITSPLPLTAGQWQYVAMTYNGSAIKLYVNGIEKSSIPLTGVIVNNTQKVYLGSGVFGAIAETRIAETARSAAWLKFEYQNITSANNQLEWGTEESR